jgi:arylsulfatase
MKLPSVAQALGCCLLLLALGTCGPREPERWNVLLVLVDTLRADRMSLYGYERPTTPHLEAFAKEAVVFTNARSQAACTFPSVNSLLTSRIPATFLRPGASLGIPETLRSLPELLREQGYATAAVSASPIVRNTPSRVNRVGGFGRGFEVFDESCYREDARCLNAKALDLLDKSQESDRPWFLYLHYMEPHAPYRPPADHPHRIAPPRVQARDRGVSSWARRGDAWPVTRRLYNGQLRYQITPQNVGHLSDLYDEEIAYFDEQLRQLVDALRERRLLEKTLIVLAADHGEEMYEHGHWGHCRSIAFETVLKTPLVIRIPGGQGLRRDALAENLDIVPTVFDYLGMTAEDHGFEGASLRPVIENDGKIRRASFGLQGVSRTVQEGSLKLIYDLATGSTKLFDLAKDPGEKTDLATQRSEEAQRLRATLLRWIESREGPVASGESRRRADELEKKLRSLGYL